MKLFRTRLIELFGLPRTGKTTSAQALAHSLREEGRRSAIIRERAALCPISDKMNPLFNYWTALSQMKEYVEACDRGIDVLIADRGLLDSAVWLHYKNRDGRYQDVMEDFQELLHNRFMNEHTLLGVYFTAEFDTIFEREYERRLTRAPGTVVNVEVLRGYVEAYAQLRQELNAIIPIYEIDTTALDIQAALAEVSSRIHAALESKEGR